jgi:hypothetical protein
MEPETQIPEALKMRLTFTVFTLLNSISVIVSVSQMPYSGRHIQFMYCSFNDFKKTLDLCF